MKTQNNNSHIVDFHRAKCIAGIVEVLEGMDGAFLEDILVEMIKERDTTLDLMKRKRQILNYVNWGYEG